MLKDVCKDMMATQDKTGKLIKISQVYKSWMFVACHKIMGILFRIVHQINRNMEAASYNSPVQPEFIF